MCERHIQCLAESHAHDFLVCAPNLAAFTVPSLLW